MRKLWQLLLLCSLVYLVGIPNADLSAASTSPQMALMFLRYRGNDEFDSYISIVERVNNQLKEVDNRILDSAHWYPTWSAKAKALLSVKIISDSESKLFITRFDGTSTTLSYERTLADTDIDLSPDGQHIISVDADDSQYPRIDYLLNLIELDGAVRTLYRAKYNDPHIGYISDAKWSPDGDYIALYGAPFSELGEGSIFIVSTACIKIAPCSLEELKIKDGSGRRLPGRSGYHGQPGETWRKPKWSSDGKRLAFDCFTTICFLDRDGTQFRRLKGGKRIGEWSPDGWYFTYRCYDQSYDVCVYDLETDQQINLTNTPDIDEDDPIWLTWPDAAFLAE